VLRLIISMVLPDPSVVRAAPLTFSHAGCLAWASSLRGVSLKVEVDLDADFVLWNSLKSCLVNTSTYTPVLARFLSLLCDSSFPS
jgi:hypothetical protein